jgi:hypothetical protein
MLTSWRSVAISAGFSFRTSEYSGSAGAEAAAAAREQARANDAVAAQRAESAIGPPRLIEGRSLLRPRAQRAGQTQLGGIATAARLRSHGLDADLLVHLGEIDERKLYLDWTFSSMFAFCVRELRLSEDVASNRIDLARAARRMPVILEALRSGQVHLAGLRVLAPHLNPDNQEKVLAEAAGKSKRQIEELVARLWPQPPRSHFGAKASRPSQPPARINQHAADQMYGRVFMERARASVDPCAAGAGAPSG